MSQARKSYSVTFPRWHWQNGPVQTARLQITTKVKVENIFITFQRMCVWKGFGWEQKFETLRKSIIKKARGPPGPNCTKRGESPWISSFELCLHQMEKSCLLANQWVLFTCPFEPCLLPLTRLPDLPNKFKKVSQSKQHLRKECFFPFSDSWLIAKSALFCIVILLIWKKRSGKWHFWEHLLNSIFWKIVTQTFSLIRK